MADTVVETVSSGVITLTFTDNGASWDSRTNFPGGLKVKSIKFFPSAANDVLKVRGSSASGPIIAHLKDTVGGGAQDISFNEGVWMFPYLLITDQTWNTEANVEVMFVLA